MTFLNFQALLGINAMHVREYWQAVAYCIFVIVLSCMPTNDTAFAKESNQSDAIRVAIYSGQGVTPGDDEQVKACLPKSKGFDVTLITAKEVGDGSLDKFDVLIHPGGSGSGQAKALGDDGRRRVRKFIERGGGFVGICAGAYLASAEYPWALKLLDARVIDDEHWARGVGKVTLRVPAEGQAALATDSASPEMHYENGPLLGPAKQKNIPDFESLATFDTEIRKNDAPKGIMKGTTAIARGQFGNGRVVCFSTHPEKTRGRETYLVEMVRWAGDVKRPSAVRND
jgi:putative intracellular protease/amidase